MPRSSYFAFVIMFLLISGCVSSPPPAAKPHITINPHITGLWFYSDPIPYPNKNVYFLAEITEGKGYYYEASVILESRIDSISTNETRNLLNGSVPNGTYAIRCELGNFSPVKADEVLYIHAVVCVWKEKGGLLMAKKTEEIHFTSPIKATDGVYLSIEKVEHVYTPNPDSDIDYTVNVTLRNDGYRNALKGNITLAFDWVHFSWDNGTVAPGDSKSMSLHCAAGTTTIHATYNRVEQGTVLYTIG